MKQTMLTLDVRPLPHSERLGAILGQWQALPQGETLRLVVEHNPVPLRFLLQGQSPEGLHWELEKDGPDAWVVRVTKLAVSGAPAESPGDESQEMRQLLIRLHAGDDAVAVKEKAKGLLRSMDAHKLALLEQGLIQEGLGREEMRRLCDVHLEIMREGLDGRQVVPTPGHPIHTLMEEHKALNRDLERLNALLGVARGAARWEQIAAELEEIRGIAHHLLEAEKHHQREEEVIFPALEQRGVTEPPAIMRQEHEELRAKKAALDEVAREVARYPYQQWLRGLDEAGSYLVREMPNHIYKEDNILYQVALQTIEPTAWAEMKASCDRIGYCCFTPGV